MYDICVIHLCTRIQEYFQLAPDSTTQQIINWCKITYCKDDGYLAIIHAVDTVIFGKYEVPK